MFDDDPSSTRSTTILMMSSLIRQPVFDHRSPVRLVFSFRDIAETSNGFQLPKSLRTASSFR
jgi:hypothetical protein